MAELNILSNYTFDNLCDTNGWNDENVEELKDKAFISIIGTEECLNALNIYEREHWFKTNHENVLNLEFDDTLKDMEYKGVKIKALSNDQAKQLFDFIENNIGKTFYIHCLAGISRSAGVGRFISNNYDGYDNVNDCGYTRPNGDVTIKLNKILWDKHFNN